MSYLEGLNGPQKEAVMTTEGPLLVLAGAGSGKTRVLTRRIAYLIDEKNVLPENILAITFTNKAADEMKERIGLLIENRVEDIWVGTFHSVCVRILRRDIDKIGYNRNFVIFDTSDQKTLIKDCIKEMNLSEKLYDPKAMLGFISSQKDILKDPDTYIKENEGDFRERQKGEIYKLYQKKLKGNNALDFDDLIVKTIELFIKNPDVLEFYQRKFRYILVDEYQDTNRAQYQLVRLVSKKHMNICVVGDDDQCIPQDSKIYTPDGLKSIEELDAESKVLSAGGHGKVMVGTVNKKLKKEYKGPAVKVKTKTGKQIVATPNHIVFGKMNPQPGVHYVYLMYRRDKGYRIGQTQGVRLNQEHGDKMWILRVCTSKEEATYYEQLLSTKYGIPTTVFHAQGRNMSLNQEYIDRIFNEIDTEKAALKLMNDLLIFEEYPHHRCNGVTRGNTKRRIINLNFFGGKETGQTSGWHSHRIAFNTTGDNLKEAVENQGFPVSAGQKDTWRVETERKDYDEANLYGKKLAQLDGVIDIIKRAKLTKDNSYYYMPISHLRPSMSIAILDKNEIIEDIVEEVTFEEYDGYVYDLSIPHFRQFICEGVVVHNSIYGWRGADIRNILDFEKDYPQAKVIKLEQNYRSTKTILEAANTVIANNWGRKNKRLWTSNNEGDPINIYKADNEHDEANFIISKIREISRKEDVDYSNFAILYRTNAQSRVLEESLIKANIPYRIVGGLKFYDRKEIKDIIAYLRLIQNPLDDISLKRIINVPKRGIGKKTIEKLEQYSLQKGESIYSVILDAEEVPGLSQRAITKLKSFASMVGKFIAMKEIIGVKELIEKVIDETGYLNKLREEDSIESRTRIENIQEFLSVALDFEQTSEEKTLEEFLANISLLSDIDKTDESQTNCITLMTLHSAKGLEFPVVFLAGMEEGIFPISRALTSEDDLEEERRLCYVGITRAKEKLYLTYTNFRTIYGRTSYNSVSRFIDEIPDNLINDCNEISKSVNANKGFGNSNKYFMGYKPETISKPSSNGKKEVQVGAKVKHKLWGVGTVVQVKKQGSSTEISVAFDGEGVKKLMLEYAPIEIL
ncbi:UvrD-helicase domain-containing protein [Caldisalinibacter kiritimatiensis]|uniref:ATP-dependent DNA helicase PcrA n=1 Tax=Caldisalinibacter kiritimatiensis TaxID=1304284 RepID=R1CNM1_9FIRM|nr:UvrD-helicase domain-containing protein [Caldisalinibacter kiritimatiensis]EOD00301.1 ATP-dependent DNA helicase UvrD/PcrA [Caldisalinibacter kiritimatiensis]